MGIHSYKDKLSTIIQNHQVDNLLLLLRKKGELVNVELNHQKYTPLIKAIHLNDYVIVRLLLAEFKANPNLFGGKYNPLMVASIKGNLEVVTLLLQFNANSSITTSEGFNAFDYSILFGQYEISLFFKNHLSIPIKTVTQAFQNRRKKMKLPYVNYELYIQLLLEDTPFQQSKKQIYRENQNYLPYSTNNLGKSEINIFSKQQHNQNLLKINNNSFLYKSGKSSNKILTDTSLTYYQCYNLSEKKNIDLPSRQSNIQQKDLKEINRLENSVSQSH